VYIDHHLLLLKFGLLLYTYIDRIECGLNSDVGRMINANMEKMMGMITENFSQLASSAR